MGNLLIVLLTFLDLFLELFLTLGGLGHFAAIAAVVDDILHTGNLALIHTLHAMQVVDTQVADGVLIIAMHIDEGFEAVLLAAVEEPVDRPLAGTGDRIGAAMVFEEVIEEIVADDLTAGVALVT